MGSLQEEYARKSLNTAWMRNYVNEIIILLVSALNQTLETIYGRKVYCRACHLMRFVMHVVLHLGENFHELLFKMLPELTKLVYFH